MAEQADIMLGRRVATELSSRSGCQSIYSTPADGQRAPLFLETCRLF
ncbi:hypothetical protein AB3X52_15720 [Nocardioides sp. DS6]|uniref:Uncharacterized protein n=1 Tax=Nocardioides eburneus TaxID=3231482 RepID=A0ABV3T5A9_9ACTN